MRKIVFICCLGILLGLGQMEIVQAGEVDVLVNKLVEKGVLSPTEAQIILDETKEQVAAEISKGQNTTLPDWVQKMKLKGDFRLRHEYSKRNDSSDQDRSRGRIRYRLGLDTKVNDWVKVAVGLASNGGSPRSTNQTFTDTFSKSAINLDYAYVEALVHRNLTLMGGKMKIPFWEPGDLLWDTDITPEGGAAKFSWDISDNLNLFTNTGMFVLDESAADQTDPYVYVLQPGIGLKLGSVADLKTAFTYYGFSHGANKSVLDNRSSPATNTVIGGKYVYKYDAFAAGTELGINNPLSFLGEEIAPLVERVGFFGEYIINPDAKDENTGWLSGVYFGNQKVDNWGKWQAKASYRKLGRDAWLDALPDSDFYSGATDVKGYEGIFEFGLSKNVVLSLDYYRTERMAGNVAKQPETILQTDLNFKF